MMNRNVDASIQIDCKKLIEAFEGDSSKFCLDLKSGAVVPAVNCDACDVGHGRSGVAEGSRFILVPSIDELAQERSPVISDLLPRPLEALVIGAVFDIIHHLAKNPDKRYAVLKTAVTSWLGLLAPPVDIELVDSDGRELLARRGSVIRLLAGVYKQIRNNSSTSDAEHEPR